MINPRVNKTFTILLNIKYISLSNVFFQICLVLIVFMVIVLGSVRFLELVLAIE